MKTVLITGCAGYIGTKLCAYLHKSNFRVIGIDNFMYGQGPAVYSTLQDIQFVQDDVTRMSKKTKDLFNYADIIIPLAAIVGAPACDKHPGFARKINLEAIEELVGEAKEEQLILFPNTNSGYGKAGDAICTEETPLRAISLYGQLKDDAEQVVRRHANSVVFRLATVFGWSPRHRLDLLINTMVYEAVTKKSVMLFDDKFMRNYIHVQDICRAFKYAIDFSHEMKGNVYNLGNDALNMTKGDLLKEIGKYIEFETILSEKTDPDQRDYKVSSQKLYNVGWRPTKGFGEGIGELIRFYSCLPQDKNLIKFMSNVQT